MHFVFFWPGSFTAPTSHSSEEMWISKILVCCIGLNILSVHKEGEVHKTTNNIDALQENLKFLTGLHISL